MERICIFLHRVCDVSAHIANPKCKNGNSADMFPFYNHSSCSACETETLNVEINNVPTCRIDTSYFNNGISELCGVSYTLVKTWFNKEKRSPSYELWQTTFMDYTLSWLEHNIYHSNH